MCGVDRPASRWNLEVLKTDKHLAANEKLITSTGVEKERCKKKKKRLKKINHPFTLLKQFNIPESRHHLIRPSKVLQLNKELIFSPGQTFQRDFTYVSLRILAVIYLSRGLSSHSKSCLTKKMALWKTNSELAGKVALGSGGEKSPV